VTPVVAPWLPAVMTSEPGTAGSAQWNCAQPTINDGCLRPRANDTVSVAVKGLSSMFVYDTDLFVGEMAAVNRTAVVHCCAGLFGTRSTE
jgi:hypothetical protein